MRLHERIDQHYTKFERELIPIITKDFDDKIAYCFEWIKQNYPKRAYDFVFYCGMRLDHWDLKNFKPFYSYPLSDWDTLDSPDRLAKKLLPLYNFQKEVYETVDCEWLHGNVVFGTQGTYTMLWYESEYLRDYPRPELKDEN